MSHGKTDHWRKFVRVEMLKVQDAEAGRRPDGVHGIVKRTGRGVEMLRVQDAEAGRRPGGVHGIVKRTGRGVEEMAVIAQDRNRWRRNIHSESRG